MSIAKRLPSALLCLCARTEGQRKMSGRLFGYARVSVGSEADVNTLESRLFLNRYQISDLICII